MNKKPFRRKPDEDDRRSRENKPRPKPFSSNRKPPKAPKPEAEPIRLNRFIANAGVCSRREADTLILAGSIKVNGKVIKELGTKVLRSDDVRYKGKALRAEQLQYVLLNKPKDFITTADDPQGRRTVMDLVAKACAERIYPVGRLDRNTTGLLLLTNDGDLAKRLTHPSHKVKKIYQVTLTKALTKEDSQKVLEGVQLDDGVATIDDLAVLDKGRKDIGLEIHIGKNRIVRRLFEALGYEVERLDRVVFASLTKKDLPRGKWRHLKNKEVVSLKYLSK